MKILLLIPLSIFPFSRQIIFVFFHSFYIIQEILSTTLVLWNMHPFLLSFFLPLPLASLPWQCPLFPIHLLTYSKCLHLFLFPPLTMENIFFPSSPIVLHLFYTGLGTIFCTDSKLHSSVPHFLLLHLHCLLLKILKLFTFKWLKWKMYFLSSTSCTACAQ